MNPVNREWGCPFSESATVFESALSPPSVFLHNNNLTHLVNLLVNDKIINYFFLLMVLL